MLRVAILLACLALSSGHAVLPVVPAVHTVHTAPLLAPYSAYHGFGGHGLYGHGLYGHGLYGHGLVGKPLVHHLLKRSPHYVSPLAHVAPLAAAAPVAVSHQSRVDLHHSAPVFAPVLPVIKPVVAPFVAPPLLHKSFVSAPYYGLGHYGGLYPHSAHTLY